MTKTLKDAALNSSCLALHIYPRKGTKRSMAQLKTVALVLAPEEVKGLATKLLVAADMWERVVITGFRRKQKGGQHQVTVTGQE